MRNGDKQNSKKKYISNPFIFRQNTIFFAIANIFHSLFAGARHSPAGFRMYSVDGDLCVAAYDRH